MSGSYFGGTDAGGPGTVLVDSGDGCLPATELRHDGVFAAALSWGWGGPPALELARALLKDAAGLEAALRYADELREILARLDGPWSVSASWLRAWVQAREVLE